METEYCPAERKETLGRKGERMSRQVFEDGGVLLTGEDMRLAMESMFNRRGAAEISCAFCQHENEKEYCPGCSIPDTDYCCSCHIDPPCSYCVGSHFEVSPYLVNYKAYANMGWRWQCFKGTEDVFNKVEAIEKAGFHLSAEILSTGEATMYIGNGNNPDFEIEICSRRDFKEAMCKMVDKFDIEESKKQLAELLQEVHNGD